MLRALLFSLIPVLWGIGCAATADGIMGREWDNRPEITGQHHLLNTPALQNVSAEAKSLTLGLASLFDAEMELIGRCDSCHGASPNFWEFEYDNKLDSIAQTLFPEADILRLVPDVPPFSEKDTLLDTLTFRLSRKIGTEEGLCAFNGERRKEMTVAPPDVKDDLNALAEQFGIDLLLLPGKTSIRLFPDGNRPKGKVEIDHLFAIWDVRRGHLLYRSCQKRSWATRGSEQIDRQTSSRVLQPLAEDLTRLKSVLSPDP